MTIKRGWDAALDINSKRMGVGVIVRDMEGSVLAAMCTIVPLITDSTIAEAVATWRAVDFCKSLEGDALEVLVNHLRKEDLCWNRYGHLIEEI